MREKKDTKIIHSLDKGLILLELIENETYPVTLHTLWKKLGWDKATILRMCNTLEKRGYIRRDPNTKQYSLGFKIFGLYESVVKNIDIPRTAKPYLRKIAQETGESAHLAFIFENGVVFMDKVLGTKDPPVNVQIGGREPLYCTALGKAFLAYCGEIEEYVDEPLTRYTRNTILNREELVKALEDIRSKGYSFDNSEYIEGVRCVAAPILDKGGNPAAVIGLSAPADRFSAVYREKYGTLVRDKAREISKFLFGRE